MDKSETISIRISPEIKRALKEAAKREHRSLTNMIEKLIIMADIDKEIQEIKEWLNDRPSPTMDPCWEKVLAKKARLSELKSLLRANRPESGMMVAQQMEEE